MALEHNELNAARVDTLDELVEAMLEGIAKVLGNHGHDPSNGSILVASVTRLTDVLNLLSPGFRDTLIALLNNKQLTDKGEQTIIELLKKQGIDLNDKESNN